MPDEAAHSTLVLPIDINTAFIDNGYVNKLSMERDMLLKIIFGEHTEAVEWFLYEWRPGFEVGCLGVCIPIHNIDDYINYMKKISTLLAAVMISSRGK